MIERADVPDSQIAWIRGRAYLRQRCYVQVERETSHCVFLPIQISHAPAGDVDALCGAQNCRESIAQKRAKHAVALRTGPGAEGIVMNGEMNSLTLCDELGRSGNSFVVADHPVKVGVHLLDHIFYPGF